MADTEDVYNAQLSKEINITDWEDTESNQDGSFSNQFEYEKFQWTPDAAKKFPDINKDMQGGNLDGMEMDKIELGEGFAASITALQNMSGNKKVGTYFFPDSLKDSSERRKSSILALSLSKEGFWRKLSRTRFLQKGLSYDDPKKEEDKKGNLDWMFWRGKNKKKENSLRG